MEIKSNHSTKMRVLMLPWLAHGHINSFFELAKRLAIRNTHIYICSTPVTLASIEEKITEQYSGSIGLVELNLPSSPELPPNLHTTSGLPPHLMVPLKIAYEMSAPQFSDILASLRPDLVIYDFNQPWAAEIALSQDIPAVQFMTFSTVFLSFARNMARNSGKEFPFPEMCPRPRVKVPSQGEARAAEVSRYREMIMEAMDRSHKIFLVKSFREIEGKFIDFLSVLSGKKVVPVGPLVQDLTANHEDHNEIMEWLDPKEKGSVVYASFGSEYFLAKEERVSISKGLELSNVDFIWVVRFPQGEKFSIEEALTEGFLDRIGNRGKIVEEWAPQAKILKHPSTGAFISHCGWNSVMESMKWGVPIVALPMHIDQPLNARVVEAVGVGVEAVRDGEGNLQSEEIAKVIRKVLVEESGADVRRKAKEFSETLERKGDEEIDNLKEELLGLCQKKNE